MALELLMAFAKGVLWFRLCTELSLSLLDKGTVLWYLRLVKLLQRAGIMVLSETETSDFIRQSIDAARRAGNISYVAAAATLLVPSVS